MMLICNADIYNLRAADLRIKQDRIAQIGSLAPEHGERVLDAHGGALLPGLNDHHLHLMSFAASLDSVPCGPPDVRDEAQLAAALRAKRDQHCAGWIRGVGYHESIAGDIDRRFLDRCVADVPLRIQHRSGRLWILNSAALDLLLDAGPERLSPSVRMKLSKDGRLYDQDHLLRALKRAAPLAVGSASERLASYGVTGITDMTPQNCNATFSTFADMQADGTLLQRVRLAGTLELAPSVANDRLQPGPTKVHLHESSLPPFEQLCHLIANSHHRDRTVAIHCVTEAELVFALAAFRESGTLTGDRIEHASVSPPALLDQLGELGLTVVTQPNFINERGDAYLADIPAGEHGWLYRCRGFAGAGIPLAAGTDAPFGHADPWRAMLAAVTRRTHDGNILGAEECLTPEAAVALFLGSLPAPEEPRRIAVGAQADLCLLDRPWSRARLDLSRVVVRATICAGELIYDRVN